MFKMSAPDGAENNCIKSNTLSPGRTNADTTSLPGAIPEAVHFAIVPIQKNPRLVGSNTDLSAPGGAKMRNVRARRCQNTKCPRETVPSKHARKQVRPE